jgi:hypothetical protein
MVAMVHVDLLKIAFTLKIGQTRASGDAVLLIETKMSLNLIYLPSAIQNLIGKSAMKM